MSLASLLQTNGEGSEPDAIKIKGLEDICQEVAYSAVDKDGILSISVYDKAFHEYVRAALGLDHVSYLKLVCKKQFAPLASAMWRVFYKHPNNPRVVEKACRKRKLEEYRAEKKATPKHLFKKVCLSSSVKTVGITTAQSTPAVEATAATARFFPAVAAVQAIQAPANPAVQAIQATANPAVQAIQATANPAVQAIREKFQIEIEAFCSAAAISLSEQLCAAETTRAAAHKSSCAIEFARADKAIKSAQAKRDAMVIFAEAIICAESNRIVETVRSAFSVVTGCVSESHQVSADIINASAARANQAAEAKQIAETDCSNAIKAAKAARNEAICVLNDIQAKQVQESVKAICLKSIRSVAAKCISETMRVSKALRLAETARTTLPVVL